jgi:hypothetical protein
VNVFEANCYATGFVPASHTNRLWDLPGSSGKTQRRKNRLSNRVIIPITPPAEERRHKRPLESMKVRGRSATAEVGGQASGHAGRRTCGRTPHCANEASSCRRRPRECLPSSRHAGIPSSSMPIKTAHAVMGGYKVVSSVAQLAVLQYSFVSQQCSCPPCPPAPAPAPPTMSLKQVSTSISAHLMQATTTNHFIRNLYKEARQVRRQRYASQLHT